MSNSDRNVKGIHYVPANLWSLLYFGTCPEGKHSATQLYRYVPVMAYMQWVCSKEQNRHKAPLCFKGDTEGENCDIYKTAPVPGGDIDPRLIKLCVWLNSSRGMLTVKAGHKWTQLSLHTSLSSIMYFQIYWLSPDSKGLALLWFNWFSFNTTKQKLINLGQLWFHFQLILCVETCFAQTNKHCFNYDKTSLLNCSSPFFFSALQHEF